MRIIHKQAAHHKVNSNGFKGFSNVRDCEFLLGCISKSHTHGIQVKTANI